jgi:ABC-type multidrug transport system fused ATPase/permease subunit
VRDAKDAKDAQRAGDAAEATAQGTPGGLLRGILRRSPGVVALAVLLALGSAALALLVPLVVSAMVQGVAQGRTPVWKGLQLAGLVLAGAVASGWSSFLLGRVGEYGVARIRSRMIRRLLAMRPGAVRERGIGDLVTRATSDVAYLRSVSDVTVTAMPVSVVMVVASLALMGYLDWVLLLIVVGTFALAGLAIRAFLRGMRRSGQARQEALGLLAERLSSALTALPTIKAYRAEERVSGPILEQVDRVARNSVASDRSQAFITPLAGMGQQIAIIGVLAVGGARVASGQLTPAHYVAFLMYLFQMVNPLMTVATGFARIQQGLASVGRVLGVLRLRTEPTGPAAEPAPVPGAPVLRFRSVTAGYQGANVLRGLDLTVPTRGVTALVGVSGVGKTTVLNLVERFLDARSGTVALHGVDVTEWPLAALRGRVAYLDQSSALLDGTVRENATLGCRTPPPDAAVLDALRRVGLAEVVAELPDGLDTRVGGAHELSGGQRQRLALVRALLSDAEVLMLDEPSSQLDGPNEELLLAILEEASRERAVLVVAHRLSTIRDAGRIVFLDGGIAVDAGTHRELVERCVGYRALVRGQFDGTAEPDGADVGVTAGR